MTENVVGQGAQWRQTGQPQKHRSLPWTLQGTCHLTCIVSQAWRKESVEELKGWRGHDDAPLPASSNSKDVWFLRWDRLSTLETQGAEPTDEIWKDREPLQWHFPWVYKAPLCILSHVLLHCYEAEKPLSCYPDVIEEQFNLGLEIGNESSQIRIQVHCFYTHLCSTALQRKSCLLIWLLELTTEKGKVGGQKNIQITDT